MNDRINNTQPIAQEKIDLFLNDIRAVCKEHGLALIGSCVDEGIWAEINIDWAENAPEDRSVNPFFFLNEWSVEAIKGE
ncbi:hypothetical protein ACYVOS_003697 [Vibrio cholerae]